ncbi:MAG: DNA-deoxyinosine glycosylase [Rhodocyclales bacterium]|nr:DNA-deoxyinosine glycosylase [Rhodocyclales bacterium]
MSVVHSFPPIAAADARVLILGSMPGIASLVAGRYYAHARNAFWPVMGALLGFDAAAPYAMRAAALRAAGVALWDVLHTCTREGSLDAMIDKATEIPNDLPGFVAAHPRLTHVFFNGAAAEDCFRRHVLPQLAAGALQCVRLPSTSPANAALSFAQKLAAWQAALSPLLADDERMPARQEEPPCSTLPATTTPGSVRKRSPR